MSEKIARRPARDVMRSATREVDSASNIPRGATRELFGISHAEEKIALHMRMRS
jgi:hypothetical protein